MNDVVAGGDGVCDAHRHESGDGQRAYDDPRTFRDRATHGSPPGHTTQQVLARNLAVPPRPRKRFVKPEIAASRDRVRSRTLRCENRAIVALFRRANESAYRPGSVTGTLRSQRATIHLRLPLPTASSGLPAGSGGPPSSACAVSLTEASKDLLTLLQVGFTEPRESPRTLVVSYTTVSPLLLRTPNKSASEKAVCFLWHCPAGHPGWALPTTLPFGARTFLGAHPKVRNAVARPTRPP
jgi:hypothetical protein